MAHQKALVQLGRFGDIINILPIAEEAARGGHKLALCVAQDFAGILDGVSYVDRLIFRGKYTELDEAMRRVRGTGREAVTSQVYSEGLVHPRTTESFVRDSWNKVGKNNRWEQIALIFDRRDEARETELAAKVDWSKPVVLTALTGISAPYKKGPDLHARLVQDLPEFNVVDMNQFKVERIYDLLGLMDRAHALVTVDTAPLHLAKASAVPVVALTHPTPWLGSLRAANHLLTRPYNQVDPEEVIEAVRKTLRPCKKIVHVWSDWDMPEDDRVRVNLAAQSWEAEYQRGPWHQHRVHVFDDLPRTSNSEFGEERGVPYVKDMLREGMRKTKSDSDIVVLTNSDIGFTVGMTESLTRLVGAKGAAYAYRFNFDGPQIARSQVQTAAGGYDGGLDLFAFTRKWLKEHFDSLPDMVMGRTMWDLVYRDLVKKTGGGELYGSIWHQRHKSFWTQMPTTPGNDYNTAIAKDWASKHDTTRPYRFTYE